VRFHPSLETVKVSRIMQYLPFAFSPRISRDGFGVEVSGYLLIPEQYFKDVVHFMSGLESKGYLIKKEISKYSKFRVTRNLNAFRTTFPLLNPKKKYPLRVSIPYSYLISSNTSVILFWYNTFGI